MQRLFPGHGLATDPLQLLGLLGQRAEGAPVVATAVTKCASINPFLLADLATNGAPKEGRPNVGVWTTPPPQEAHQKSAKAAAVADSFRVLAKLVAWYKPGEEADCAVIKATAKPVTPIRHRSESVSYTHLTLPTTPYV